MIDGRMYGDAATQILLWERNIRSFKNKAIDILKTGLRGSDIILEDDLFNEMGCLKISILVSSQAIEAYETGGVKASDLKNLDSDVITKIISSKNPSLELKHVQELKKGDQEQSWVQRTTQQIESKGRGV